MEGVPQWVPLPCIGTFCDVISMDACVPLFAKSMSSSQSEGIGHTFLRDVKQWHHPETLIFGWHHGWPWTRATNLGRMVSTICSLLFFESKILLVHSDDVTNLCRVGEVMTACLLFKNLETSKSERIFELTYRYWYPQQWPTKRGTVFGTSSEPVS